MRGDTFPWQSEMIYCTMCVWVPISFFIYYYFCLTLSLSSLFQFRYEWTLWLGLHCPIILWAASWNSTEIEIEFTNDFAAENITKQLLQKEISLQLSFREWTQGHITVSFFVSEAHSWNVSRTKLFVKCYYRNTWTCLGVHYILVTSILMAMLQSVSVDTEVRCGGQTLAYWLTCIQIILVSAIEWFILQAWYHCPNLQWCQRPTFLHW